MEEQTQINLFKTIIPKKIKNVHYREEIIDWGKIQTGKRHILDIYALGENSVQFAPLHKIYFVESLLNIKMFEFSPKNYIFKYHFELFSNKKNVISSNIPILNINDFLRICEIFEIGLLFKKSDIEELSHTNAVSSGLTISNRLIKLNDKPKIFLSHVNKTATIKNIFNKDLESYLYNCLIEMLNQQGLQFNKLRDSLHKFNLTEFEFEIINNMILKIQHKLDIDQQENLQSTINNQN